MIVYLNCINIKQFQRILIDTWNPKVSQVCQQKITQEYFPYTLVTEPKSSQKPDFSLL